LSFALTLTALALPVQIMMIYDHGATELFQVAAKISLLNWMVILSTMASASLLWRASPWARISVPVSIAVVAINNWFVGMYETDFSMMTAHVATALFAFIHAPLLLPKARHLLRHPHQRWWLVSKRRRICVPIFLGGERQVAIRTETFDLSETGAFIMAPAKDSSPASNERISVSISLGMYSQIRCEGRVVRVADAKGSYPAGVGIQFVDMPTQERRELRRYLDRKEAMASA
jgi:hypothetical protein